MKGKPGFPRLLSVERTGDYDSADRAVWELQRALVYYSHKYGRIVVPAGFRTNYASVPRLPVLFLVCGDVSYEEAALHDYLYTKHLIGRTEITREVADEVFLEALLLNPKIGNTRARLMYAGVRAGGRGAWVQPTTVDQPMLPEVVPVGPVLEAQ